MPTLFERHLELWRTLSAHRKMCDWRHSHQPEYPMPKRDMMLFFEGEYLVLRQMMPGLCTKAVDIHLTAREAKWLAAALMQAAVNGHTEEALKARPFIPYLSEPQEPPVPALKKELPDADSA